MARIRNIEVKTFDSSSDLAYAQPTLPVWRPVTGFKVEMDEDIAWQAKCVAGNPDMPTRFLLFKPDQNRWLHVVTFDSGLGVGNDSINTFFADNEDWFIILEYFQLNQWNTAPVTTGHYDYNKDAGWINFGRPAESPSSITLTPLG